MNGDAGRRGDARGRLRETRDGSNPPCHRGHAVPAGTSPGPGGATSGGRPVRPPSEPAHEQQGHCGASKRCRRLLASKGRVPTSERGREVRETASGGLDLHLYRAGRLVHRGIEAAPRFVESEAVGQHCRAWTRRCPQGRAAVTVFKAARPPRSGGRHRSRSGSTRARRTPGTPPRRSPPAALAAFPAGCSPSRPRSSCGTEGCCPPRRR